MNIAVISLDLGLVEKLSAKLKNFHVKGYNDSLSLIREINFFNPDVIVYDATGGELAFNVLEFLLTREKIKNKVIKVLISKENPIDESILSKFSNLEFYDKDTEIDKLIEDISSMNPESVLKNSQEENTSAVKELEEIHQPPQDIEALLGETISGKEAENIENVLKEIKESKKSKEPLNTKDVVKITVEISPKEINDILVEKSIEKLVNEIKNDLDIQKIKEEIQRDFFEKLEKEMKESAEDLKKELEDKIFQSFEAELKDKIKESIKENVMKITTQLVKEKLEQVFGSK